MSRFLAWRPYSFVVIGALTLLTIQGAALLFMGHPLISASGLIKLWQGVVASPENSQQITDWYTFSHIIHGFLFYLLLWAIFPRMPIAWRLLCALGIEASWEIIENTPMVINHYRAQALAQGYVGDSVINSLFDTLAAALGFIMARKWPIWLIVVLAILMELGVGYAVRDGLTLNVIQFIYPFPFIWQWQSGI